MLAGILAVGEIAEQWLFEITWVFLVLVALNTIFSEVSTLFVSTLLEGEYTLRSNPKSNNARRDVWGNMVLEAFDVVLQTDTSSALTVQTKNPALDLFFGGHMLEKSLIAYAKSANESLRLLAHVRQCAEDAKRGNPQFASKNATFHTQFQRHDGSLVDTELVAAWSPLTDGRGDCFVLGLRFCSSFKKNFLMNLNVGRKTASHSPNNDISSPVVCKGNSKKRTLAERTPRSVTRPKMAMPSIPESEEV